MSIDMVFPSIEGYVRFKGSGRSFSASIVAGVAATRLLQEPGLTPRQLIVGLHDASAPTLGISSVIGCERLDMAKLFPP